MPRLTGVGATASFVAWLVLVIVLAAQTSCVDSDSCRPADFVLAIVAGAGLLVPAFLFGLIFDTLRKGLATHSEFET
jgi:hypothetical protein